ncbi:MAG: PrsW family glutamic-type intramembrane protease [Saprospiraceae bacterium]
MSPVILLLLAIAPGFAIAAYFYFRDRSEPEPSGLLLISVLFGVISFFITRGLGFLLHEYVYVVDESPVQQIINAFLFIGLLGEGAKFLFLRGFTYYYKAFNQPFDGIVYAVMVAMGYATAENILYVTTANHGIDVLRLFTIVPANAVFAVIMGYFLGEAKLFPSKTILYSLAALLLAAIAHGYYDYFLDAVNIRGLWMQAITSLALVVFLSQIAIRKRRAENLKKMDS